MKHSPPRSCNTPCTAPSPRGAPGLTPWQMGSPGSTTTTATYKNQPQTWVHWLEQHKHLLLGTAGHFGHHKPQPDTGEHNIPHPLTGTDPVPAAHQKAKCHLGASNKMCSEKKKSPVFAAQRLGSGAVSGREIWKHWLRDNCCRFMGWDSVSSKKRQTSFFNLIVNYMHYLF